MLTNTRNAIEIFIFIIYTAHGNTRSRGHFQLKVYLKACKRTFWASTFKTLVHA